MATPNATVLLIDDEPDIREILRHILRNKYTVLTASNGEEGIQIAKEAQPQAIVLDIIMPKMGGIETCEALRSFPTTKNIPIIILSALKSADDRIKAFNTGADDYISKPFFPDEIIARIDAKLRRTQDKSEYRNNTLICGNLLLNQLTYEAQIEGDQISLSRTEFNIIKFLLENRTRISSRQEIISASWKDVEISHRLVDLHILALRKKLKGFNHSICSVYGKGYIIKPNGVTTQRDQYSKDLM